MIKTLFTLLILGQIIMAATIDYIETQGMKIPIIFESDKRLPLVTMQFVFTNSGTITDSTKAGLARFTSKMMGEGTKKLGASAFADALEAKAIHIASSTGTETFVMEMGCLKEEFDEGLNYFDMLLKDPNISEDALNNVKSKTVGSLSRKENDFDYVASNELKSIMFEGSTLANPSSGTIESVKSIELSDVDNFVKTHLVSSKLIVVIGGDVDLKSIKKKITKVIDSISKGESSQIKNYEVSKKPKQSILKKETQQAYIYFGSPYNMDVDSKDHYKAKVAAFILGAGGFGSRLMEEIRVKRGLAYSAYARIHVEKSRSFFSGYLQTKPESLKEAQNTVNEVIAEFVKNGATKDELAQTKKFMLGSEPLRVETMSQRLNRTFMEFYKGRELGYSAKELKLVKELKLKDLNQFIKEHTEINDLSYAIVTK